MEHKQDLGHKEPVCPHPTSIAELTATPATTTTTTTLDTTGVEEQDVSFFHDFIAGGIAGSASVIVGHPMDTLKVRMQTSTGNASMWSLATSYGGLPSLFRGMAAPLSTACVINAIIFSSYGWSSRTYDQYIGEDLIANANAAAGTVAPKAIHDSSFKAFTCGSFAGLVQALVICPQEHVKCRLQIQHGEGSPDHLYKGPLQATRSIVQQHGVSGLYRGWCITCWREVPAFGAYFAFYDLFKDRINSFFANREISLKQTRRNTMHDTIVTNIGGEVVSTSSVEDIPPAIAHHNHTWMSSALAGGLTGALTWAMVYPFDVIKTQIQTMPLSTEATERKITVVTRKLVQQYGWQKLFRGLTVTCLRAFPVNGIIFPVYEYTLMHVCALEY